METSQNLKKLEKLKTIERIENYIEELKIKMDSVPETILNDARKQVLKLREELAHMEENHEHESFAWCPV